MGQRDPGDRPKSPPTLTLPAPALEGIMTLEEALFRRRSVREFIEHTASPAEVGQLLWAGSGLTGKAAYHRTNPSAGALHPLEVYAILPEGIYHYQPQTHTLLLTWEGDARSDLAKAALGQWFIGRAACVLAIAAVYSRTTGRYGERGRLRYVPMDAAHAAQNVLLQAVAMGLGAVPVGAFDDEAVRRVLGLAPDESPLYLLPVGKPRT